MPNENDTEASRKDALNAYESLFGDAESSADDTVAKEQDAKSEPDRKEPQGSEVAGEQAGVDQGRADESDQDPRESDIAEKQADKDQADGKDTGPPEELKIVLAIKDGRATIGVQRPSSDPYIEPADAPDLSRLTQEVLAVVERARAKWEDEPKYPTHERPARPARRRTQREQGSAQDSTDEGEAARQQPETLRLS